jgi:hypothetical protein
MKFTPEQVIEMAREAHEYALALFQVDRDQDFNVLRDQHFASLAADRALEAAAGVIHTYPHWIGPVAKEEIGGAIRAMKEDN